MKQKIFSAFRKIFKLQNTDYLEIEHNTFADEQCIPTFDNEKIIGLGISQIENILRIYANIDGELMFQDINIEEFEEDELYDLYEDIFDYFMSEEEFGTSKDFLDTI